MFFLADDGSATWSIVARDREHAIEILRDLGATWEADTDAGWVDVPIDVALEHRLVEIREMGAEEVARCTRCRTEDERGTIPLAHADLGDAFCTAY